TPGSNGWFTSASVSVTLSPFDATSGVAATFYTIDGGAQHNYAGGAFSVSGEGPHRLTFWSVDAAGHPEDAEPDSCKIDSVPPTTTVSLAGTSGTNGWFTSSVTVTLTPTGDTSGVTATHYTLDGVSGLYTGPFTVSGDAVHTLLYFSVDGAGNQET